MQRWTSALLAVLLVGAIALVVVSARSNATDSAPASASSQPSIAPPTAPAVGSAKLPTIAADAGTEFDGTSADSSAFSRLPDGGAVPALPNDAPKSVVLGVVLFRYRGAQLAAKDERTREKALELSNATLALAKDEFAEAVKKGDPGSSDDAGRIPRGVLEPALEYIAFTLDKGQVYPTPIDTPRGYWIVKRVQ